MEYLVQKDSLILGPTQYASHYNMDYLSHFQQAMQNTDIACNDEIIADGQIHRFHVDGDKSGSKNGWYVLYSEGIPAGSFGSWRTNQHETWCAKSPYEISAEEKAIFNRRIEESKKQRDETRKKLNAEAKIKAKEQWDKAQPASRDHAYLVKKDIQPCGIRQTEENVLIIPLRDIYGDIHSLQYISETGSKWFINDGAIKSYYYQIGETNDVIYICEGFATAATIYEVTRKRVVVAFNAGNLTFVAQVIKAHYPDQKIIIAADNDQWGQENIGLNKAKEAAQKIDAILLSPNFKNYDVENKPTDFNDLLMLAGIEEVRRQLTPTNYSVQSSSLIAVDLADFLKMTLPPRELILAPWLPKAGLCMIHARPGVGKTHLSFGIAYAVATGSSFLKWQATKPRGVLLIDGEMPASVAQERLARIVQMNPRADLPAPLKLITPDLQKLGMPDLGTVNGQELVNQSITDEIDLIIVDNLSCLVRTGKENDSESWQPVQTWALNLRARGKSVLFIHHQGKTGAQRGSSKKEDVLDTVISLNRPEGYTQNQGACFVISFDKARGFHGDDAKPFEVQLTVDQNNNPCWVIESVEDSNFEKVVVFYNDGISQAEITKELRIDKSTVSRYVKRAREEGLIKITKGDMPW